MVYTAPGVKLFHDREASDARRNVDAFVSDGDRLLLPVFFAMDDPDA